jgi:hypothetical protein
MADPAAPTTSRPARSDAKAPRTTAAATPPAVSTETENKLARAARSAQRLAELSDVPADDSTLDLFPDDPTRAALEAMNIDVRQGTLTGFELPDEVLAAVEAAAADATDGSAAVVAETPVQTPVETKAVRRNARAAAKAEETVRDGVGVAPEGTGSGVELNAAPAQARAGSDVEAGDAAAANVDAWARAKTKSGNDNDVSQDASAPAVSPSAQQATPAGAVSPETGRARSGDVAVTDAPPMSTAWAPRSATSHRQAAGAAGSATGSIAGLATDATRPARPPRQPYASSTPRTPFGPAGAAGAASAAQPAPPPRATPELDHARATAFADTVDALYGVIADQRRAASEHSRRMKRMLSIVVGVLLVTVAIGVAQMLLLVCLTHDTTVRQQRIEETLLGQQATLATLLQTESAPAPASVAPAAPIANAGNGGDASANPDAPAVAAPRQPAEPRPSAKAVHTHKHKAAAATSTTAAHTR